VLALFFPVSKLAFISQLFLHRCEQDHLLEGGWEVIFLAESRRELRLYDEEVETS